MKILTLKNIEKKYKEGNFALQDIQLDVEEGEFLVIVGPSGSGKSTLLRLIANLEKATKGEIYFFSSHKEIAMVFQNYSLYPHMNVYENIAFPLTVKKLDKKQIQKKVNEVAETLEISSLLHRKVQELSGGEQQRVALGRALIRNANIFLFDEALANLDANLKVQMRYELLSLHKKIKKTFIYVTHDQKEAMSMADRIVVMKHGKIEQIGSPKEVYQNPNTSFIAKFIGNPPMNLLEGKEYILGIRPEDIIILEKESTNSHRFTIEMIEFTGPFYALRGNIKGQNLLVHAALDKEYKIGETLFLEFPHNKQFLFDITTKQRIQHSPIEELNK